MITRGDLIWLGVSAGVTGGITGGLMLGLGSELVLDRQPIGLLFIVIGGPVSGLVGWVLARRLARQLQ